MPQVTVEAVETVGTRTAALELRTPEGFVADPGQFVLVRATVDGEGSAIPRAERDDVPQETGRSPVTDGEAVDGVEETGYYTLSSPDTDGSMEITVEYVPEGTLAPWLAERSAGDTVEIEGPFGDVRYTGEGSVVVLAEGPGIGPAVGIGERATHAGHDASIVFWGEDPPHRDRLDALEADGATVSVVGSLDEAADTLAETDGTVYVFGFESFVRDAKTVAEAVGVADEDIRAESFGAR